MFSIFPVLLSEKFLDKIRLVKKKIRHVFPDTIDRVTYYYRFYIAEAWLNNKNYVIFTTNIKYFFYAFCDKIKVVQLRRNFLIVVWIWNYYSLIFKLIL